MSTLFERTTRKCKRILQYKKKKTQETETEVNDTVRFHNDLKNSKSCYCFELKPKPTENELGPNGKSQATV